LRASSLLASGAAVVALIVVASLSVAVIDSHSVADPLQRDFIRPASAPLPKAGTLWVEMYSNQNFSSVVSDPLAAPAPVSSWPMKLITINSSVISEAPIPLSTDAKGVAFATLLPGEYVLQAPYNTLNIVIPVRIFGGNTTTVKLDVTEGAYSVVYSEASDVGAQPSVYVELRSSTPVASASEPVTLQIQNEGAGSGYQVYGTVVSDQPPVQGTQWLGLESRVPVDLAGARSVLLATWAYSTSTTVGPTGGNGTLGG
jgi:hypothetical protein